MTPNPQSAAAINLMISAIKLPRDGMPIAFKADERERKALAEQLNIPAVERLKATLRVAPWRGDGVKVTGSLTADVVQSCVVTLEPVRQRVEEPVELVFVPERSKLARIVPPQENELFIDPEGADIPDVFSGDRIDLGSALAEIVALGLDPYPRAAGVGYAEVDTDPAPEATVSPFAALGALRKEKPDDHS
ncbi:YceD family protein [Mangrovicella endophytica]|uniref:YceD family protein n=1 Tax=Mangrovicella endophytica TaxID=2066697 RepID=UPI001FDF50C8|nr:DUF177 domain-containing protein [Mangrovicella endophytica]